jgi:hypothetical protein
VTKAGSGHSLSIVLEAATVAVELTEEDRPQAHLPQYYHSDHVTAYRPLLA